jgi:hypothetical protein
LDVFGTDLPCERVRGSRRPRFTRARLGHEDCSALHGSGHEARGRRAAPRISRRPVVRPMHRARAPHRRRQSHPNHHRAVDAPRLPERRMDVRTLRPARARHANDHGAARPAVERSRRPSRELIRSLFSTKRPSKSRRAAPPCQRTRRCAPDPGGRVSSGRASSRRRRPSPTRRAKSETSSARSACGDRSRRATPDRAW